MLAAALVFPLNKRLLRAISLDGTKLFLLFTLLRTYLRVISIFLTVCTGVTLAALISGTRAASITQITLITAHATMVKALAKYYRICLSKGHDVITIREEVEHIRNYMIIQNMRYDNIIGSEIVVESQVEESLIPKLTLQPLVENSIYHGMKVKEGKTGTLYLTAYKNEDEVIIKVSDTGTGMSQEQIDEMNEQLSRYEDSFGYGVRNVNKRIELLFGAGYGLNYQKNDSGGVTVVIHLPYQTEIKKNTAGGEWTCV